MGLRLSKGFAEADLTGFLQTAKVDRKVTSGQVEQVVEISELIPCLGWHRSQASHEVEMHWLVKGLLDGRQSELRQGRMLAVTGMPPSTQTRSVDGAWLRRKLSSVSRH